ncbi:hypothetical protein [Bacillus toyonensis]|uniref:hypothetical protein n=1 Tax=Bacillus toyonensis TaxID=155322 RepID=UPI0015D49F69|nr:hypothetical protein [Bacillus toyonensis]
MSVSVYDKLQLFAQEIQSFLSPNTLRDLAIEMLALCNEPVGIKSNTSIYQKNPNPDYFQDGRIKKGREYIQIDMETLILK